MPTPEPVRITICPECGKRVAGFTQHFQSKHPNRELPSVDPTPFTEKQMQALELLATGGARYGTRFDDMTALKDMGLCYAHSKGDEGRVGNWTWRPTEKGWSVIEELGIVNPIERKV